MSGLNNALMLSILAQMTQDNNVTGNQHVQDDINRLTQYVQTGVDPGGSGSPGIDPAKVTELLDVVQANLNTIFGSVASTDPDTLAQQVQSLLESVKAVQQYIQTGQTVDSSTTQIDSGNQSNGETVDDTTVQPVTAFKGLKGVPAPDANPLARHQQNFPTKG